jgi:hypothetical protein
MVSPFPANNDFVRTVLPEPFVINNDPFLLFAAAIFILSVFFTGFGYMLMIPSTGAFLPLSTTIFE